MAEVRGQEMERERDGRAGVMGSSRDGDQSEASVSLSDQSEAWADIEA